ncbi:transglycosylase SLT domain-containing protein [Streptomyces sp. NPDC101151]|uniref:LysM peptidoglycan-binding domain-containing protein n=1 Tax=Streptomyces sp. NPDC101151 TaxID=3366115 RepID=UPI0037F5B8EB
MQARGKHRRVTHTQTGRHRRPGKVSTGPGLTVLGIGAAALTLPAIGAVPAAAAPHKTVAGTHPITQAARLPAVQQRRTTYVVVAGDSLWAIADRHALRGGWKRLYEDNRTLIGDNPSLIHPGAKLTLNGRAGRAPGTASADGRADRSPHRTAPAPAGKPYPHTLDGWIRTSLKIMAQRKIPGSYQGIHRTVVRESSGNPRAINTWDSNAAAGTPSKGLMQVIDPTFRAYHVPGTSWDPYDPVANITAACNYAAARYGSIDNVVGAY